MKIIERQKIQERKLTIAMESLNDINLDKEK
jgi:hypothetical protein